MLQFKAILSRHRFWIQGPTRWAGGLHSEGLHFGGLHCLESRAIEFGSGDPLTGLGAYNLGVSTMPERPLVPPKFPRVPQEGAGTGVGIGILG